MIIRESKKVEILKRVTPFVAQKIFFLKKELRCSYVNLADNLGLSPVRLSEIIHHYRLKNNVLPEPVLETLIIAEIVDKNEIISRCKLRGIEEEYIESLGKI